MTAARFIPLAVRLANGDAVELIGEKVTEHFAITPMLGTDPTGATILTSHLALTHIPTGLRVTTWALEDMRALAKALQELPIDWATFTRPTQEQSALVHEAFRKVRLAETEQGWPWPEWAGDEQQPATSLLGMLLDRSRDDDERLERAFDLGRKARQQLPEELGRLVDAHLIAGAATTVTNGYGATYLLAVLQRIDPEAADRAARDLASAWDAGDPTSEWMWQWRQELAEGQPLTLHGFPEIGPALAGVGG